MRQFRSNLRKAALLFLGVVAAAFILRFVFFLADYVPLYYEPKDLERERERQKQGQVPSEQVP